MAPLFDPSEMRTTSRTEPDLSKHKELLAGLECSPKSIPCSYLYDATGSELYDQIVTLPEYYPYRTELDMLGENMPSIIEHISPGSVVVELGCGSATKTGLIVNALLSRDGPEKCFYEGVDCSSDFLQLAKQNMIGACPALLQDNIGTICALYLDGLKEARRRHPGKVLCVLWLGSSVGNLDPAEASDFFKQILAIGGASTQVFLCTDLWKDKTTLHAAYHDSQKVTEAFIKNGLDYALSAIGAHENYEAKDWTYNVVVNAELQQVEMWLVAPYDMDIEGAGIHIAQGERVLMEVSRKFTQARLRALAFQSGWCWQAVWSNSKYSLQMLYAPELALKNCWADTDALFASMPDWCNHPITIRHPFCFYYGHVAAFAKLKILPEDEASTWDQMFSRGIDPDVLDPSSCHGHPEAPSEWPSKHEIIQYSTKVRQVIQGAVQADSYSMRGLYLALEHERMHQETLAYMQAQQRRQLFEAKLTDSKAAGDRVTVANGHSSLPKPVDKARAYSKEGMNGHAANGNGHMPNGSGHASNGVQMNGHAGNNSKRQENGTQESHKESIDRYVPCPAGTVVLGVNTVEQSCGFVWDNEGPQQAPVAVNAFAAAASPVSVAAFRKFLLEQNGYDRPELWTLENFKYLKKSGQRHPATWTVQGDDVWVHTNQATKFWTEVADEPVWVSLAEAQAYCAANDTGLMTEAQYSRLLDETSTIGKSPRWHMLRNGGWEWTSSEFTGLPGFQPMHEYPEYSADFFDGKHFVLKGSSPVTHASVVRDSFRNFYQHQYPYMFAKFRCVAPVNEE